MRRLYYEEQEDYIYIHREYKKIFRKSGGNKPVNKSKTKSNKKLNQTKN